MPTIFTWVVGFTNIRASAKRSGPLGGANTFVPLTGEQFASSAVLTSVQRKSTVSEVSGKRGFTKISEIVSSTSTNGLVIEKKTFTAILTRIYLANSGCFAKISGPSFLTNASVLSTYQLTSSSVLTISSESTIFFVNFELVFTEISEIVTTADTDSFTT